jgi:AraC family transcriptional regulator
VPSNRIHRQISLESLTSWLGRKRDPTVRSHDVTDPPVLLNPSRRQLGHKNAIMSTTKLSYYAHDVEAPVSIKWMVSGWGLWETADGQYRVEAESYLVLNHNQIYTITIDLNEPSESFCIFFANGFVEGVYRSIVVDDELLLADPLDHRAMPHLFLEHIWADDGRIIPQMRRIRRGLLSQRATREWFEDQFHYLARFLLEYQHDVQRSVAAVPAIRASTRTELFRRVYRGRDYIHGHFMESPSIDSIASVACLSPHHFHRLYTKTFRQTPINTW